MCTFIPLIAKKHSSVMCVCVYVLLAAVYTDADIFPLLWSQAG